MVIAHGPDCIALLAGADSVQRTAWRHLLYGAAMWLAWPRTLPRLCQLCQCSAVAIKARISPVQSFRLLFVHMTFVEFPSTEMCAILNPQISRFWRCFPHPFCTSQVELRGCVCLNCGALAPHPSKRCVVTPWAKWWPSIRVQPGATVKRRGGHQLRRWHLNYKVPNFIRGYSGASSAVQLPNFSNSCRVFPVVYAHLRMTAQRIGDSLIEAHYPYHLDVHGHHRVQH